MSPLYRQREWKKQNACPTFEEASVGSSVGEPRGIQFGCDLQLHNKVSLDPTDWTFFWSFSYAKFLAVASKIQSTQNPSLSAAGHLTQNVQTYLGMDLGV